MVISLAVFYCFWEEYTFSVLQCEIYSFDENGSGIRDPAMTELRHG